MLLTGSPRGLLLRGSHRSVLAELPHTAPQNIVTAETLRTLYNAKRCNAIRYLFVDTVADVNASAVFHDSEPMF